MSDEDTDHDSIDLTIALVELSILRSDAVSDRLSKLQLLEKIDLITQMLRGCVSASALPPRTSASSAEVAILDRLVQELSRTIPDVEVRGPTVYEKARFYTDLLAAENSPRKQRSQASKRSSNVHAEIRDLGK